MMHVTRRVGTALLAAAFVVLAGCSSGSPTATDTPTGSPVAGVGAGTTGAPAPATTAPELPPQATGPARPSAGCTAPTGAAATPGQPVDRTIDVGGTERTYREYVPASATAGAPIPLVVDLHGLTSNRTAQAATSRWEPLGADEGFVVVTPQGIGPVPSWNANDTPDNRDLPFMEALLDQVDAQRCIDTSRVYVNGISNGGLMSSFVACKLGSRVAAVGLVAGIAEGCRDRGVMPAIVFWGKRDCVLPFYGGLGPCLLNTGGTVPTAPVPMDDPGTVPPVETSVARWAERNGCDPDPTVTATSEHVEERRFHGCDRQAVVDLYVVSNGSHSWPGSGRAEFVQDPNAVNGVITDEIDATALMWAFFQRYQLGG